MTPVLWLLLGISLGLFLAVAVALWWWVEILAGRERE